MNSIMKIRSRVNINEHFGACSGGNVCHNFKMNQLDDSDPLISKQYPCL